MGQFRSTDIRNVALIGHGHTGKTSLAECLLFATGATSRLGRIEDGNTTSDFDPEEIKRQTSIHTSIIPIILNGTKINMLDTPGYADFIGEVAAALRAVDSVTLVVDSINGIQVQSIQTWEMAQNSGLHARAVIINRLDKENADFDETLKDLCTQFGRKMVAYTYPIGKEGNISGVVDILANKAYVNNGNGETEVPVPTELTERIADLRELLIEQIAEVDDTLAERFLEGENLDIGELSNALRKGIVSGSIYPVCAFSTIKNIGIKAYLSLITDFMPSPEDITYEMINANGASEQNQPDEKLAAFCFKTQSDPYVGKLSYVRLFSGTLRTDQPFVIADNQSKEKVGHILTLKGKTQEDIKEASTGDIAILPKIPHLHTGATMSGENASALFKPIDLPDPMYSVSIAPHKKGEEEKLGTALNRIAEEDPTLTIQRDPLLHQTILSGIGDQHIDVVLSQLKAKFGVEVDIGLPKIPYKETIKGSAKAQGKYKKQSGGRGQYGDVWLELRSNSRSLGHIFEDKIVGGVVPKNYIPAVEKGIKETMEKGVLAGCEIIDITSVLYDGSYHAVDSSEMAFKIAASMAFRNAFGAAQPILLEPVYELTIIVPEKYTGDVIGDLSSKRGKISGMEPVGRMEQIKAIVPQADILRYPIELRALTHGEGYYSSRFSHYEEVPPEVANKVINEAKVHLEELSH